MSKRIAQPTRSGQLPGAQLKIVDIYNDTLREHVTIVNLGTQAQPMGGWVLASLRGEQFYTFPDDLILLPHMRVSIHSGEGALDAPPHHLFWTVEQIWNNRGDVAVLFDANGFEVDRRAHPYKWTQRPQRTTTPPQAAWVRWRDVAHGGRAHSADRRAGPPGEQTSLRPCAPAAPWDSDGFNHLSQ